MVGFRRLHKTRAAGACLVALGAVGCSLLTGLDRLEEVECVGGNCTDGGPVATDAPVDADLDEGEGGAPVDVADAAPEAGDAVDSAQGQEAEAAPSDSAPPQDAPASEMGADVGPDVRDAPEEPAPKCGSAVLTAKSATTSSYRMLGPPTESVEGPPALAIDGDFSTRWESVLMVDPQWLDVDFGAPVFMGEVDILWQVCAINYLLEVSDDESHWTPMQTITGNGTKVATPPTSWTQGNLHKNLAGVGRYLRVYGTSRCAPMYGYSIWELRVLGDTNASCTP